MTDPRTTLQYATPVRRGPGVVAWLMAFAAAVAILVVLGFLFFTVRHYRVAQAQRQQAAAAAAQLAAAQAAARVQNARALAAPVQVTLVQRTAKPLPGTGGSVVVRIADITGGQVLLTVEDPAGKPLLDTASVKPGDARTFSAGNANYEIELIELKNFLTGDDFAVFEVRQAGTAPVLSENEKIERLIDAVAQAKGVIFIRNGDEHSAADAAAHLKRKHEAPGDQNMTARQFIEHVASRSSMSGEAYQVRLPDGGEVSSQQWLGEMLREIESGPTRPPPPRNRAP